MMKRYSLLMTKKYIYDKTKIKELRKKHGLSQTEFAERIGTKKQQISVYEVEGATFNITTLQKLCNTFQVAPGFFFTKIDHNDENAIAHTDEHSSKEG